MHDTPRTPNRRAKAAIGLAASALVLGGIGVAGAVTADDTPGTSDSSTTTSTEVTEPTSPDTSTKVTDTTAPDDDVAEGSEAEDEGAEDTGELPGPDDNFGQWVSAQAREGGVDGQEISAAAHARNEARKAAHEDDGEDEADEDDASATSAHAGPPASNPGKGKGGPHS